MKIAVIALALTTFAAGAASAAASRVTDVDFLKANRCMGLATGLTGVVDPTQLNSFIKAEGASRVPYIMDRADQEYSKAKKEAKSEDRKERLTAELTGPCQAYLGGASNVAKQ